MIHSLYTRKDIFLRELISNASDALDRLRFESLTRPDLLEGDNRFEIRLDADSVARTLTVSDTGIGMSRAEVIANIGTIAKSGTRELRSKIRESGSPEAIAELIGQFGVGFYSAFMVADRVKLITRRAGETEATQWESMGDGTYTIQETEKRDRGTSIVLFLRKPDPENGIEDYTSEWRISNIVKEHSDFISYPIITKRERPKGDSDSKETVVEDVTLNSMKPVWKRTPAEVTAEEYAEFYKHLSHDWTAPLKTIHFKAEGTFEYDALLYVPSKAPFNLYYADFKPGLRLFAKRVMIMEECEDLLPQYLRFIRGVVDAADLPLNISRQRLQQDHQISLIRKRLTRKILDTFQELFDKENAQYLTIWREFGRALKEGVATDFENKSKILALLLFQSSNDSEKLTTLRDYVARMKPEQEQEQIFYLTGESRAVLENSPHLEALREKGYEVLYLVDPVDEFLLSYLTEFEGKKLKSAAKGVIALGDEKEKEIEQQKAEYQAFLEYLQKELDAHVKEVRLSNRLVTSPSCLVVEDYEQSPMMERLLRRQESEEPKQKRVLELNSKNALVSRLRQRYTDSPGDPLVRHAAEVLFGLALLSEGSALANPAGFNKAVTEVLGQVV